MGQMIPFPQRELSEIVRSRIPKRFWSTSFDSYRPATNSQHGALMAVKKWLAERSTGPMLALVGEQGTGKSHLLYSAAHELLAKPGAVYVRRWYALVDQLRSGTTIVAEPGSREKAPSEVRSDWWEASTVLLDEVRPTSGTDFDATELAKFSCHAYDECKAVLITTNTPLEQLMGAPAASRYTVIQVVGPDGRKA